MQFCLVKRLFSVKSITGFLIFQGGMSGIRKRLMLEVTFVGKIFVSMLNILKLEFEGNLSCQES